MKEHANAGSKLIASQGVFYLASGLWPVFDRTSFERVTGPKTDFWLVRTVGLLIASTGLALTAAGARRKVTPEILMLGAVSAGSLAGIDIIYASRRRISRIYLLDAVVETGLAALGLAGLLRRR